jgi:hypothetical protein
MRDPLIPYQRYDPTKQLILKSIVSDALPWAPPWALDMGSKRGLLPHLALHEYLDFPVPPGLAGGREIAVVVAGGGASSSSKRPIARRPDRR